jgi:hypothetical protein
MIMSPQDPEYAEKPYDFDPKTMIDDRLGQGAVSPLPVEPNTDTPRDHLIQVNDEDSVPGRQQGAGAPKAPGESEALRTDPQPDQSGT